MNKIIKNDWYENLVEDLRKLEFTGIVLTKWNIGKRILEDFDKFGKPEYGSKRIENIAKDLYVSERDVYRCIQFAEKCHSVTQFKNKSWHFIANNLLPERIETKHEIKELPKGKYQIIYADPPWQYYKGGYKNQSQHYDNLTIDELSTMEVDKLADDNCILFMWATFPILPEAINLISQWGFNYSTVGFVWVKSNRKTKKGFFMGLGNWTRSNAELCLIATKGSIERKNMNISQIIYSPVGEHSKKPDIVREKILQLVGDLPRIELFARQQTKGWEVWGDQI